MNPESTQAASVSCVQPPGGVSFVQIQRYKLRAGRTVMRLFWRKPAQRHREREAYGASGLWVWRRQAESEHIPGTVSAQGKPARDGSRRSSRNHVHNWDGVTPSGFDVREGSQKKRMLGDESASAIKIEKIFLCDANRIFGASRTNEAPQGPEIATCADGRSSSSSLNLS
jgi:hypothetical protein